MSDCNVHIRKIKYLLFKIVYNAHMNSILIDLRQIINLKCQLRYVWKELYYAKLSTMYNNAETEKENKSSIFNI